jgi:hypothetical protein
VKNSILYTKVEKFKIIARAPRLEPEACRGFWREGYKRLLHRGLYYTIFFTTRYVKNTLKKKTTFAN